MTAFHPREIEICRSSDGRWTSRGPNNEERTYSGEAARHLEELFNRPAEQKR